MAKRILGKVYYNDVFQGKSVQGTEEQLVKVAKAFVQKRKNELGDLYLQMFPNPELWELRLIG